MIKQKHPSSQEFEENPLDQGDHIIPEDKIETVYLYAYTEDPELPSFWGRVTLTRDQITAFCVGLLALALIVGLCFIPNEPSSIIKTIAVPGQFLTQELQASVTIVPTGIRTIPATKATGVLTIYNGSFLNQSLPAGFVLSTQNGVEVATDQTVIVPGANLPTLGIAEVSAHAVVPGASGNIALYAIQTQYGSSLLY